MMKGLSQQTRARGWRLAAVHALGLAPLFWLGINLAWGAYWVNPLQAAIQRSGDAAILLLLASLTCTPLSWWRGWVWIGRWRRPLGLYAFGYALQRARDASKHGLLAGINEAIQNLRLRLEAQNDETVAVDPHPESAL